MEDIWHNRATDSLPILFATHAPAGAVGCGDMRRHVAEAECMLYDFAAGLVATARAGSDAQLAIRANTGTGTLATTAGCGQLLSEYGLPWTTHISRNR